MNKQYLAGIVISILVISGIAFYANSSNKKQLASESEKMNSEQMMKDEKSAEETKMMEKDSMNKGGDEKMMSDEKSSDNAMMAKSGSYQDYSPALVASEQKAGNKVVLFFHATWCPYCKAADTAFKANLDKIPKGVTILKTDYDSNSELKTKYGVTYQHTFVQIDNNGTAVTKWNGGDIDMLIKNIK